VRDQAVSFLAGTVPFKRDFLLFTVWENFFFRRLGSGFSNYFSSECVSSCRPRRAPTVMPLRVFSLVSAVRCVLNLVFLSSTPGSETITVSVFPRPAPSSLSRQKRQAMPNFFLFIAGGIQDCSDPDTSLLGNSFLLSASLLPSSRRRELFIAGGGSPHFDLTDPFRTGAFPSPSLLTF